MQTGRKIILFLLLIAISGPWAVERLSIPEPHECTQGFRVDENFCGYPISGLLIFMTLFGNIFGAAFRLIAGAGNWQEFVLSFLKPLPVFR